MSGGSGRVLGWVLCLLCLVSCERCGPEVVAEIARARGDVQRDHHAYPGQFTHASVAEALHLGDGLRTGKNSEAELRLFPEGTARIEERTLVRFMSERPSDGVERLRIEEGVIELSAAAVDLELDTGHGIARIKRGSRIRVRASEPEHVQLDVLVGRVSIERPGRRVENGSQGESITLASPAVVPVVPPKETRVDARPDEAPNGAEPSDVAEAEPEEEDIEIVNSVDFKLTSLESATVHAPQLPIDVAFPVGSCAETRVVEFGAGEKLRPVRAEKGATEVVLRLKAGRRKLRVRCGAAKNEVTLRVVRDAATQELPRTAPEVEVAADGRRYTVRYENLLPALAFSWPGAPASTRYELLVKRVPGREQRFASDRAERQLRSGELGEGEYTFSFQTASGARSPDSTLRISFDNTARAAYLSSPAEGASAAGTVAIAGGALVRSEVSVGGVRLAPDSQGRFTATIPHAPNEHAIAVRVSHPSTGVHYYVRRLR